MSVLFICPACEHPHSLLRLPVAPACAKCGTDFPASTYELAVEALRSETVPRPTLLTLGMAFSAFWTGVAVLVTFTLLFSSGGSYTINGQPVSRDEFLNEPFVRLFPLVILYTGTVVWALYREVRWARPLLLAPWLAYALGVGFVDWPGTAERVTSIVVALIALGVASWYLYGKQNVVGYFRRHDHSAT